MCKLSVLDRNTCWIVILMLNRNTLNNLTVCKQMSYNLFRNKAIYKAFAYKSNTHTHTHTHIYIYIYKTGFDYITHKAPSASAVEYTDCILDMTLNNLMPRLQPCRLGECGITLSLPLFPDSPWPGVVEQDRVLSMGQIELFDNLNWVQRNDFYLIELLVIAILGTI